MLKDPTSQFVLSIRLSFLFHFPKTLLFAFFLWFWSNSMFLYMIITNLKILSHLIQWVSNTLIKCIRLQKPSNWWYVESRHSFPYTSLTSLILLFKQAAILFVPSRGHLSSSFIPSFSNFHCICPFECRPFPGKHFPCVSPILLGVKTLPVNVLCSMQYLVCRLASKDHSKNHIHSSIIKVLVKC